MIEYTFARNPDTLTLLNVTPQTEEYARVTFTILHVEDRLEGDALECVSLIVASQLNELLATLNAVTNPGLSVEYGRRARLQRDQYQSYFRPKGIKSSFIATLRASLKDTASIFTDSDLERHVVAAIRDFEIYKPRLIYAEFPLEVGRTTYDVPSDFIKIHTCHYGAFERKLKKPWEADYPYYLPTMIYYYDGITKYFRLNVVPTQYMLSNLGANFHYRYYARHIFTEYENTIEDMPLLLLRSQMEVMKELSIRNSTKPVQFATAIGNPPAGSTPSAIYNILISEWEKQIYGR